VHALERLSQDHRQQKESFERLIADQRALWEEEKAKWAHEEKEYQEALRLAEEVMKVLTIIATIFIPLRWV
jgi:membrane protein involved in colicin uptake